MIRIFQLTYTFNSAPLSYKKVILGKCDIGGIDIKEYLKNIDDIHDFDITILSRAKSIIEFSGTNVYHIYISKLDLPGLIKINSDKDIYVKEGCIITNKMINDYIIQCNIESLQLNKSVILLKEMSLNLERQTEREINNQREMIQSLDQIIENRNTCNIM